MIIDTHAHLNMEPFDVDRDKVIQRAYDEGVGLILNIGTSVKESEQSLNLADKYDFIYAAVGIHPHSADLTTKEDLIRLESLISHEKVLAVGEIGLDFFRGYSEKEAQVFLFTELLTLARRYNKPVIVHSREAERETVQILKDNREGLSGGILHCFSGDEEMMKDVLGLGFYISFAGQVTYPSAGKLREVANKVPTERLLVETDCPFLSPQEHRGKRNEPSYVRHTIEKLSSIRGVSPEDIERVVETNFFSLFNIRDETRPAEKISYSIRGALYLNITNRCSNECSFCSKFNSFYVQGHNLRLSHEPSFEEVINSIDNIEKYTEVIFCGFGEPTLRLELLKQTALWLKGKGKRVRLNTNGHGNIINKRNILPELQGLVDSLSVSLNADNEEAYNRLCHPKGKTGCYGEVLRFISLSKDYIPEVVATVIDIPDVVDIKRCERLAKDKLGVGFRVRRYNMVGA